MAEEYYSSVDDTMNQFQVNGVYKDKQMKVSKPLICENQYPIGIISHSVENGESYGVEIIRVFGHELIDLDGNKHDMVIVSKEGCRATNVTGKDDKKKIYDNLIAYVNSDDLMFGEFEIDRMENIAIFGSEEAAMRYATDKFPEIDVQSELQEALNSEMLKEVLQIKPNDQKKKSSERNKGR